MSPTPSYSTGRDEPEPDSSPRVCECPCHNGADIFHVVACCGSILGRRRSRESLVPLDVPQARPSAELR